MGTVTSEPGDGHLCSTKSLKWVPELFTDQPSPFMYALCSVPVPCARARDTATRASDPHVEEKVVFPNTGRAGGVLQHTSVSRLRDECVFHLPADDGIIVVAPRHKLE